MNPHISPKIVPGSILRTLFRYNWPYLWSYVMGGGLGFFYVALDQAMPLIMGAFVDRVGNGTLGHGGLWLFFLVLVVLAAGAGVGRYFQRSLMIGASRRFEYDLRRDFFAHIQKLSRSFYHGWRTGDIMARATNDLGYVRSLVGPGFMNSVTLLRVPLTLAIMAYLSIHLTLLSLGPIPMVSLIVYAFLAYMHRQSKVVQDQFGSLSARAQENLAGARVVKAYGIEDREVRDFKGESRKYMRESLKLSYVMAVSRPLIEVVIAATMLTLTWKGGLMVIRGAEVTRPVLRDYALVWERVPFTLGDFSAYMACLIMLVFPLVEFGHVVTIYQRGAAAMKRLLDLMTAEPSIRDHPGTRHDIQTIQGHIRLTDVSFAYGDGPSALKDVSLEIPAGQTIAVVGATGSGKTTLVSLLLREYDPVSGTVWIDGVDARDIPVSVLRGSIGYVPQDTFLFSDTIRENMAFGRADAPEEVLARAAEIAQFTETVESLPDRYDTMLGERGINLSGGQKQRLAIARALARDPAILILDDALSSVDTNTEEQILNRLRVFMKDRTSIIISHRISTVREADRIFVLKDGRITEQGTHQELLALDGVYAHLHQRQQIEKEIEEQ